MKSTLPEEAIKALVYGLHGSPFDVLGMHAIPGSNDVVVRTFQPHASSVDVVQGGQLSRLERVHKDGLFEKVFPGRGKFAYRLRITGLDNHVWETEDAYRFPLQITDFDLHLFAEGTNYRAYNRMGAHPLKLDGVEGVHFAVWAPNAIRVSLISPYNKWDGRHQPMQRRGTNGIWEIFVPHLRVGDMYKFEIKGHHDYLGQKSDPYAFASELRPRTASVIWDHSRYSWNDEAWIRKRAETNWFEKPVSVYEVHLSSWRRMATEGNRWLSYRELADQLIPYVQKLGYTHIEVMPLSEHPFDGSWGYQTIGYFSPTSRFGSPDDLKYFIDQCHQVGIGVILDWVPAHFPKDSHGLAYFDGSHLYEHSDPREGEHKDWGTLIFNYGRNEVKSFLMSNAIFWTEMFHIDGLRVDAVASMLYRDYSRKAGEWIPNMFGGRENLEAVDFIKKFNEVIHQEFPGILTFAEESTAWPKVSRPLYDGGLGFGLKWNMGWMHDILEYISKEPVHRKFHHNSLTFSLLYAFTENFILPFSHDEVVHGKGNMLNKMPGDVWQKFANLRALYAFMYAHPGKKLLFMGCEFGQWEEWNFKESLDWHLLQYESHQKLQDYVTRLNRLYKEIPALHEIEFSWEGFDWIDFHDRDASMITMLRKGKKPDEFLVCVFNFTPVTREAYRVGVPMAGTYEVALNSDAAEFGGSNSGSLKPVVSEAKNWNDRENSILVGIPPLGALYLRPVRKPEPAARKTLAGEKPTAAPGTPRPPA